MRSDILFFVIIGKMDHLQQIIDGSLRFSPSQRYIELEEKQHNKGQGDLLEGRMKIKCTSVKVYHPDTNQFLGKIENVVVTMAIQDVKNIPAFCLTAGNRLHCLEYINECEYTVKFNDIQKNTILKNFPDADAALVFLQPEKFINDITRKYNCISDFIRYYDYDILTTDMLCTILGVEEIKPKTKYYLTYDNKFRHLLCKDMAFKNQDEYRFLILGEYIEEPKKYEYELTSDYILVNLKDFFNGIAVSI